MSTPVLSHKRSSSVTHELEAERRELRGNLRGKLRGKLQPFLVAAPMLVWQLVFFVAPLLFLVALTFWEVKNFRLEPAFVADNWLKIYSKDWFRDAWLRSFCLATVASVATSCIAFPVSYALAFRLGRHARRFALFLLVVPFFTSYLVRIYSWQVFLSDNGIVNALLQLLSLPPVRVLNSVYASLVGYITLALPLVMLLQCLSLSGIDRAKIEAAYNLGCSTLKAVFLVIVPCARAGLVVAWLFAFILAFGDFVSPVYLGGSQPPTLSILITDITKSGQQWPRAAVVAVTMIVTLLAVAFAALRIAYPPKRGALA